MKKVGCLLLLVALCSAYTVDYTGDEVLELRPETQAQLEQLQKIYIETVDYVDWWKAPIAGQHTASVHVNRVKHPQLIQRIQDADIPYEVTIHNLQQLIDAEKEQNDMRLGKKREAGVSFPLDVYHTVDEIYDYVQELSDSTQELSDATTFTSIGKTIEGRDIMMLKLQQHWHIKPSHFIDCGIHAREWISHALCTWIITDLLTSTEPEIVELREQYDWYIVPITNPDGYAYAHEHDRMWRKNRRDNEGSDCMGVDLNRNWDVNWCQHGASKDPCSEVHCGTGPFSEPETAAVSAAASAIKGGTWAWSVHSYMQMVLVPYGKQEEPPADFEEMMRVANIAANTTTHTHGETYDYGSFSGGGCGLSSDWYYDATDAIYTYTYEVRPDGGSENGFILDPKYIIPTAEEVWAGIKAATWAVNK